MNLPRVLSITAWAAAALYASYLCMLYYMQGALIYPGTQNRVDRLAPQPKGAEVFHISTVAGDVEALFLPASADADAAHQPVVIFGHGNGEVIDYWVSAFQGFQERGVGVLLVEYPGYGRSTGSPSEQSIRAAMDGAYDRVAADPRVDPDRIFGFGQSLGGGAICLLARDRPLRALILQSTFTSLDTFAASYWAPSFLLRDHFDNLSVAKRFQGPMLVIHGRDDRLIPWKQGFRLASASGHAVFRLYDCGHGCWDPDHLPFWHDVIPILLKAGVLPPDGHAALSVEK
jgi:pimeloyl-ACP methyl ester carboxylesterase